MKLPTSLGETTMAAFLCVIFSITIIECILLSRSHAKLFNTAGLMVIAAAAALMTSIAIASGWSAATSFTLTYGALSLGLIVLNASLYSPETLFIPLLGAILMLGELVLLIFPAQVVLRLV